jgi:hypothetical protein
MDMNILLVDKLSRYYLPHRWDEAKSRMESYRARGMMAAVGVYA